MRKKRDTESGAEGVLRKDGENMIMFHAKNENA